MAYISRYRFTVGRWEQQELKTAGHIVSAFRKKRAIHVCAQLTLSSLLSLPRE